MISLREVSSAELEWEEDSCGEMPTTRRSTLVTVKEEGCQSFVAEVTIIVLVGEEANMTTFDYDTVGADKAYRNNRSLENHRWLRGACESSIIKQGLPDCLVGAEKITKGQWTRTHVSQISTPDAINFPLNRVKKMK